MGPDDETMCAMGFAVPTSQFQIYSDGTWHDISAHVEEISLGSTDDVIPENVNRDRAARLLRLIPGLLTLVKCPEKTCWRKTSMRTYPLPVWDMIQHLNDIHHWSREVQIADWLESLDIDLSIVPEEDQILTEEQEALRQVLLDDME